jgi:hypothetical protein
MFLIFARFPDEKQLDVSKKFEDQVELVKKEIIPIIKKSIDKS